MTNLVGPFTHGGTYVVDSRGEIACSTATDADAVRIAADLNLADSVIAALSARPAGKRVVRFALDQKKPNLDLPYCWYCGQDIVGESVAAFEDDSAERAHKSCKENADEKAWERSEERKISDFYGASTPQTESERYVIAATEKERLG